MGLDTDEIVLELESRFGISLPDDQIEDIHTVGQLEDYLCSIVKPQQGSPLPCMSARAFYQTRRVLSQVAGIELKRIRPGTTLSTLFSLGTRRNWWKQVDCAAELKIPGLRIAPLVESTQLLAALSLGIASGLMLRSFVFGIGLFLVTAVTVAAMNMFTAIFSYALPATTVGEMSHQVLSLNLSGYARQLANESRIALCKAGSMR